MACVDVDGQSYSRRVTVHLRILVDPKPVTLEQMKKSAKEAYRAADVLVHFASTEHLKLPDQFKDIDLLPNLSADHRKLFGENRGQAAASDIVVFFIRSTFPPASGYAGHPDGKPGAVVVPGASRWTMAHEIGHVLGIPHAKSNERLMFSSTSNITKDPPVLGPEEILSIHRSPLVALC